LQLLFEWRRSTCKKSINHVHWSTRFVTYTTFNQRSGRRGNGLKWNWGVIPGLSRKWVVFPFYAVINYLQQHNNKDFLSFFKSTNVTTKSSVFITPGYMFTLKLRNTRRLLFFWIAFVVLLAFCRKIFVSTISLNVIVSTLIIF
jgi:hypothetical protein